MTQSPMGSLGALAATIVQPGFLEDLARANFYLCLFRGDKHAPANSFTVKQYSAMIMIKR